MDLQLAGKTCLITGSTSGIGAAAAKVIAAEGARVAIHGRDPQRADAMVQQIRSQGGDAIAVVGDLGTNDDADRIAGDVLAQFGHLDILINNVGYGNPRGAVAWLDTTEEEFLSLYNGNVISAVRLVRRLAPQMKERRWGRIIMVGSAGATQPVAILPDYQAAKAALVNLTVSLALSLAHTGVTANCVTPAAIMTEMHLEILREMAVGLGWGTDDAVIGKRAAEELYEISVDRAGVPEDVAHLTAFLASPLADFITGSNYRVDGGQIKSIN